MLSLFLTRAILSPLCVVSFSVFLSVSSLPFCQITLNQHTRSHIFVFLFLRFQDPAVQADLQLWPFKVAELPNGSAGLQVKFKEETLTVTPEEVSAAVR